MNLWRRSKSWFQESFPVQKESFEPQDYLEQEKQLLKAKYDQERTMIEKQFHYEMLEAKVRFENESRRLQDEHSRLKARNIQGNEPKRIGNGCGATGTSTTLPCSKNDVQAASHLKKTACIEDGLEWDPVNELKGYTEDDSFDSWEIEAQIPSSDSPHRDELSTGSRDSAYGSISMELQRKTLTEDAAVTKKFQLSDIERKIDQLRASIRQEIAGEYDDKFREERKFLYSVIDELEENVGLLRKQKEDIVTIFDGKNGVQGSTN